MAPRESPERLCPDRALLRLCCRAERGTASTATSTSMVTPSLQTDAGVRAAAPGGHHLSLPGTAGAGEAVWKGCASPPVHSAQPPCSPVRGVVALAQHAPCEGHGAGRLAVLLWPRWPWAWTAAAAGEGGSGVWSSILSCSGAGQRCPQLIHWGQSALFLWTALCWSPPGTGPAGCVGLTFSQVVQLHHAEVCRRAAVPATPAAPAQRQHHGPVHVGEHQGHAHTCGQTSGHCQPLPRSQVSPTATAPLPSMGSALGTHPQ